MSNSSISTRGFNGDIRSVRIVYTMSTQKRKKVFPIKLDPQVYQDLKLLSKERATSMSSIIRDHFVTSVQQQAQEIRSKNKMSLFDHAQSHAIKGKMPHSDFTDDELLYLSDL
ncbi:MAG: hypothetical protein XD95_0392 [Microgenomates bacterium 39_7]|nr:MAG: hypothetical protein XD95_0392 [Microgenomates bacterium 39_7]